MVKKPSISISFDSVPWNLRFSSLKERRYREHFFETNNSFFRLSFFALGLTAVAYFSMSYSSSAQAARGSGHIPIMIMLIVIPICASVLSYLPYFKKIYYVVLPLFLATSAIGGLARIHTLPVDAQSHAYGGILFLLLANYGLIRQHFYSAVLNGLAISAIYLINVRVTGILPLDIWNQVASYFLLFNLGGGSVAYLIDWSQRKTFIAKELLEYEHERAENLLRNILPQPIANRLKSSQTCIADHIPEVSVLFADIVGFTERARKISPSSLVTLLDQIFCDFDAIMERHNIEKIKTIGDSYMAASGLLDSLTNHCDRLAEAALDIMEYIETHDSGLQLRIGIHTGPVVAGVIGRKKMIYDLWGDTVNIASRMESHSANGQIQVSEAVYKTLGAEYILGPLRTIPVKGQGDMRVAYLQGRRSEQKKAG